MVKVKPSSAPKSNTSKLEPVANKKPNQTISEIKPSITKTGVRPPLHEPRFRVQLPPRSKIKIQRWPTIQLPPLKRKPWNPNNIRKVPLTKPKPVIDLPPLKRKPWRPPEPTKPKPLPKIEYPSLKMRSKPKIPKKRKQRVKPVKMEQTFIPFAHCKLDKVWNNFKRKGMNFMILCGNYAQSCKKYHDNLSGKQAAASTITCLGYSHIHPISKWNPTDLDSILDIGDMLYKTTVVKSKVKELRPDEISPIIYINLSKVSVCVGNKISKGTYDITKEDSIKTFQDQVTDMLNNAQKCILGYGEKHYACWLDEGVYHIFIPEDMDEEGNPVRRNEGACCLIRCTDLRYYMQFLMKLLSPAQSNYRLYSFEILKVVTLQKLPDQEQWPLARASQTEKPTLKKFKLDVSKEIIRKPSDESIKPQKQQEVTHFQPNLLKRPETFTFSKDFKPLSKDISILRSIKHINGSSKAPAVAAATLLMLTRSRSNQWTIYTLNDIFFLAKDIFEANPNLSNGESKSMSDIQSPIPFQEYTYVLRASNVIFGQLMTSSVNVADLETALQEFFAMHDVGVLHGSQLVTVWHQSGHYFMFDPKERDERGQKYIHTDDLSNKCQHKGGCITCYKQIKQLVDTYISNVPPKNRKDLFRIIKVEILPYIVKPDDWFNWKALNTSTWILRGSFTEGDKKFDKQNRNNQGVCMAAVTIAFTKLIDVSKWNTDIINEILDAGDEFYSICVLRLKFRKKFFTQQLRADELERKIKLRDNYVYIRITDVMINGCLIRILGENYLNLYEGLSRFFEMAVSGILIACDHAIAVFKDESSFYIFDPHARDEHGKNPLLRHKKKQPTGLACGIRFKSLQEMASTLISNFVIKNSGEFNINQIEVQVQKADEKPDFHSYSDFQKYHYAGIIRALDNFHEDMSMFPIKSRLQTFCNLITACAMTQIIPSIRWTESDIKEILLLGYDLMLQIPEKENQKLWAMENCKIGSNEFKISNKEESCLFVLEDIPKIEDEKEEKVETLNIFEPTSGNITEITETSGGRGDEPETDTMKEASKDLTPTVDLEKKLRALDDLEEAHVIIESDIFEVAIWKKDGLYFLFDPKQSLIDGSLTAVRKRLAHKFTYDRKLKNLTEELRKKQVATALVSEMDVVDDELKRYRIVKKFPSIMNLKSKKEEPIADDNPDDVSGSSVVVFSSESLLLKQLLKNIPEENMHDEFNWHLLEIKNELKVSKAILPKDALLWHNYNCFKPNHWILRGFTSQKYDRFTYDNSQDYANNVVALSFAINCLPSQWTSDMIDIALKYGSRLYSSSLHRVRKSDPKLAKITRLRLEDLVTPFVIDKTKFATKYMLFQTDTLPTIEDETDEKKEEVTDLKSIPKSKSNTNRPVTPNKASPPSKTDNKKVKEPVSITTPAIKPISNLINLKAYLTSFFENNAYGILCAKRYSVGVFKDEDTYYMFDPHETGPNGIRQEVGTACLTKYTSISRMADIFLGNIEDLEDGLNMFELYKISIESTPFPPPTESPAVPDNASS